MGKKELRKLVDEFSTVPAYDEDKTLYSDWRDPREFTLSDLGVGECAGEVVDRIDFDLQKAEQEAFDAQLLLDDGDVRGADELAYRSMLTAAHGLVRLLYYDARDQPDAIVTEFRARLYDTQIFWDKYAGGKFAGYLFHRHDDRDRVYTAEAAHHLVEEANLFIEAAHSCHARMLETGVVTNGAV